MNSLNSAENMFVAKQKANLEKELKRLEEQFKSTKKYPEYGNSDAENAQEVEEFQQNLGLQKNLKSIIKDTKLAIKKIESGKYGSCESCKGLIEQGRLKAYPAATLCVTCVSKRSNRR